MAGEFDFIDWIRGQVARHERVIVPPGDDLAALKWDAGDLLIVGVDQVLDGVHFDSAVHSPADIGRKVMNRNLSDCAAMACLPAAAVATVALPRSAGIQYAKELFLGMKSAADAFDFPIVGGDTASWDGKLAMTVTILGRTAGIAPITRAGAKPRDGIYVTGALGGSILGRHMTFEPRVHLARQLAQTGKVTAMIDVSDGLARDLRHVCRESNVGAVIDADRVPIHPDAVALFERDGVPALGHALGDGEDHELLFAASADLPGAIYVGRIVPGDKIELQTSNAVVELEMTGWEHRL
jgi:thiamine-monophosphate kinase